MKNTPRVSTQHVSVCTFETYPWGPAPRAHVETCARGAGAHGDVLSGHTTHTTHTTQHHTETETEEEEETKEKKTTQEKREDSFSVWWCMAVLC